MNWLAASTVYLAFFAGAFIRPAFWWQGVWALVCVLPLWQFNTAVTADDIASELLFAAAVYGFFLGILAQIYRLGIARLSHAPVQYWPILLVLIGPAQILADFT